MDNIDPFAIRVAIERAAIIRLIKAHAADCERRGARSLGHGYLALVSEIEDAMQHDLAHVATLEGPQGFYRYRGIAMPDRAAWYVSGGDNGPHGGAGVLEWCYGVLEWCYSEQDAKERMGLMARYPQFEELSIGKWED